MIKIFLTVRNRLAITKKCLHALGKHSEIPHQIYVYDNASNHLVDKHFQYFYKMYSKNKISQITFTTMDSTFNAFSKASTCNFFGRQHEDDPNKDSYDFLLMLDNDIIVTPGWDIKLKKAWKFVRKNKLDNIRVIGQRPGGIKGLHPSVYNIDGMVGRAGKLGGSGLWSVKPSFFRDIGFLDLNKLVGHDKKHDQSYWLLMDTTNGGKPYIMGLDQKLGIHCGKQAGSVCNRLTRSKNPAEKLDQIKFVEAEKNIEQYDFDTFYNSIVNNQALLGDW